MPDRNLISIKQINKPEFSGYIVQVTSGLYPTFAALTGASGTLATMITTVSGIFNAQLSGISGFSFSVPSGVDDLRCYFSGAFSTTPKMSFDLKCPNTSEGHLIDVYPISGYPTGAYVYFSNTIPTNGYVLDVIAKI
jgi:hypothetical protein